MCWRHNRCLGEISWRWWRKLKLRCVVKSGNLCVRRKAYPKHSLVAASATDREDSKGCSFRWWEFNLPCAVNESTGQFDSPVPYRCWRPNQTRVSVVSTRHRITIIKRFPVCVSEALASRFGGPPAVGRTSCSCAAFKRAFFFFFPILLPSCCFLYSVFYFPFSFYAN